MRKIFGHLVIRQKNPYRDLEKFLGYRFRNRPLLEAALTHRSFRFENPDIQADNQRLEFLGDAVLGLVTAAHLYDQFADKDEGWLTSLRSQVTSGKALAALARDIPIGEHVRFGKGEESSGGRRRASNLTDALEAVIGAAYLDGGMKAVERIFRKIFLPLFHRLEGDIWADNPKGKLQEYAQRVTKSGPRYQIIQRDGPPHAMTFTIQVTVGDGKHGIGHGRSKHEAERNAAVDLLRALASEKPKKNVEV
jgi:ribonuclease-3